MAKAAVVRKDPAAALSESGAVSGLAPRRSGAGLGLRRSLLDSLLNVGEGAPDFIEAAPENWHAVGGARGRKLAALLERYPIYWHGLSLNLGGTDPLDDDLIDAVGALLDRGQALGYSEHLSFCAHDGHLYELLPLPFTEESVHHVAARVRQVQYRLGRRIALENSVYYLQPWADLSEGQFIRAVVEESDAALLLDVNNVYVNAQNHGTDPLGFLQEIPLERVDYLHVAGHRPPVDGLSIDTHGEAVHEAVWALLAEVYARVGPLPTLLERDFDFPPLAELLAELARVRDFQQRVAVAV